ncbi:MAG: hypothetical protein Q4F66_05890 [Clostridium sp.]|nr:hypothetical protein [Clostridium sp.]
MDTRSTSEVLLTEELLDKLVVVERKRRVEEALEVFKKLEEVSKKEWIKIRNKKVYYIRSKNFIIADSTRWTCSRSGFCYTFDDYNGRAMKEEEAKYLFSTEKEKNPLIRENKIINVEDSYRGSQNEYVACKQGNSEGAIHLDGHWTSWGFGDRDTIKIPVLDIEKNDSVLETFINNKWIPDELSEEEIEVLESLQNLYHEKKLFIKNDKVEMGPDFRRQFIKGEIDSFYNVSFKKEDILADLKEKQVEISDEMKSCIAKEFLECDTLRAKINPYDIKRLEDPNLGHWDLWRDEDTTCTKIKTNLTLIGRNPLADIKEDGIVGIDFGTKSTIVVYQDGDDNTQPMRIGRGDFSKKVKSGDYENPTVMEFINLESFLERYEAREGRPYTLWEDLTISHTAANSLFSVNTKSDEYYSFFNDLKQWAGDKTRQIRIKDKKGHERVLPAFVEIEEGEFNPIEVYAYYLGLFINNMYKGIYLNYILSFPVTYEKEVREKIIASFERGIKKALPVEVLGDEESMKKFRILQGASEPAAYAICALQEYGFDLEEDEEVFYGIFDFGGGTTDFDFGIWRAADMSERRYDYVINHFGAGGDKYLGGENLLELLAFEVFKANQDKLIEQKITFYKPAECKIFAGSEVLISQSQEARLNTKQLMEKLRPLWEEHEGYGKLYENNIIKVMLFDKAGILKPNFELDIDMEKLQSILTQRIEKGIKNFFEALKLTFNSDVTKTMQEITIFLAGNSSKSRIVKELFEKYIEERTGIINKRLNEEGMKREYFKVYPPLGTDEALEIQREKELDIDEDNLTKPTGKTGVAYGLIEGRPGSRIKVISEKKSTDEVKFNFYIGYNARKKFKVAIDREVSYNEWIKFIDASEIDFELYYTNLPEATTNQLPIKEISKKICRIDNINEDADVYIRAVGPSIIEYAVANEQSLSNGQVIGEVTRIEFK